jgi:hypothetical protein
MARDRRKIEHDRGVCDMDECEWCKEEQELVSVCY